MQLVNKRMAGIFIGLVMVLVINGLILPLNKTDLDGVHPALAGLQGPYRSVFAESYLDGGSIGLQIVDGNGMTNAYAIPVQDGQYLTFVPGMMYVGRTNEVAQIVMDAETRAYICYLLETRSVPTMEACLALIQLRGAPRDYGRGLLKFHWQRRGK